MFLQATSYVIFALGVPWFLMLTGFLNRNKTVNRDYYKGCIRVLVSYVFFSVVTILFRKYYLMEELSWIEWGKKILDFTAIPYAWYIEMWIGLFLLTPFLNMLYKAIPTQRQKKMLLLTLLLLVAVAFTLNSNGRRLAPNFWKDLFPVLYFYLGSYIAEYKPKVQSRTLWLIVLVCALITPCYNLLQSYEHPYSDSFGGHLGVIGVVLAISIFLLLYQWNTQNPTARTVLSKISLLSLDMYLCCYMMDRLVYPYFIEHHFVNQSQFGKWFFVIIPILFTGSFAIAWVKDKVWKLVEKMNF